jgi:hypothetical protein
MSAIPMKTLPALLLPIVMCACSEGAQNTAPGTAADATTEGSTHDSGAEASEGPDALPSDSASEASADATTDGTTAPDDAGDAAMTDAHADARDAAMSDAPADADAGASPDAGRVCAQTVDAHTLALWHFDEGTGLTAHDSSGHGHDALLGGSATANAFDPQWNPNGRSNGDLFFTPLDAGGGTFVSSPTASPFASNQVSLEMWIRPEAPFGTATPFATDNISLFLQLNPGGTVLFQIGDGKNWAKTVVTTTNSLADGAWHYVAMTYDGSTLKAYVDGVEQASVMGDASVATPVDYYVGGRPGNVFGVAEIDEVRVSDIARSASEIAAVAAACP